MQRQQLAERGAALRCALRLESADRQRDWGVATTGVDGACVQRTRVRGKGSNKRRDRKKVGNPFRRGNRNKDLAGGCGSGTAAR
eukprot:SAG31_NODE_138_length_22877_cov_29.540917_3_plen_84_part_00